MAETTCFDKKRKANERQIEIAPITLLVGKKPTRQKRIKARILMPLSGKKMQGMPTWIAEALAFVEKSHDAVSPEVKFAGFDISFSGDSLFGEKQVTAQKCQMRGFEIAPYGDSENPDVGMTFSVYMPFSDKLYRFLGQNAGEDIYARFEQMETQEEADNAEDDQMELGEEEEEPENEEVDGAVQ